MKGSYKTILWVAVILLAVSATLFAVTLLNVWPLEKWDVFANATVTADRGGFELSKNSTDLTFGKVKLAGASTRYIEFTNNYDFPVELRVSAKGSIAQIMPYFEPLRFEENESKRVALSVVATENTSIGYYDGKVIFKLFGAKNKV